MNPNESAHDNDTVAPQPRGIARTTQILRFLVKYRSAGVFSGLDLDADLGTLDASLQQQTGDRAKVRMRYRFAGQDIDTVVSLRRIDGRWYLADYLRHAEAAIARPLPPAPTPAPDAAAPATPPRR